MSATSVGVAPSGECLRSKGRYGSCGWQAKLYDPLAIGPYLSALEMRYHDDHYRPTNRLRSLANHNASQIAQPNLQAAQLHKMHAA